MRRLAVSPRQQSDLSHVSPTAQHNDNSSLS